MHTPLLARYGPLGCTLATLAAAGSVQAQVQIYGTIDAAVGQIETQNPGAPNAPITRVRGVHSGDLQTSYIGFRGTEDLGGGLRARFQLEAFLRVDTGQSGRFDATPATGADPFWSRESFVGIGGDDIGELRLGNNVHPTWLAMIQTSALGTNSVFSPGFRQLFNGGTRGRSEVDTSMVNSVRYQSPYWAGRFGNLSGSVAVQAGEGSGTRANYSANVGWRSGPFFVTAAMSSIRHAPLPTLPGARHQNIALVGGSYDAGVAKLFAQYTAIDNDRLGSKDKVPHAGLTVPTGSGAFQLAHAIDKNTTATTTSRRKTTTAGYVHNLSKRTDLYAFVMRDRVSVGTANSQVVGMRHQF